LAMEGEQALAEESADVIGAVVADGAYQAEGGVCARWE
jgi:hypothetical protein